MHPQTSCYCSPVWLLWGLYSSAMLLSAESSETESQYLKLSFCPSCLESHHFISPETLSIHTGYPKINPTTDSDFGQVTQPVKVSIFPFSKMRIILATPPAPTSGFCATQVRQNYMNVEQNCRMFSRCKVWLLSWAVQGLILGNWDFPLTFVRLCFAHLSRQKFALRSWAKDTVVLQITMI